MSLATARARVAPATPPRRGRGRPARKGAYAVSEAHMLDAAFQAFAKRGYEGTTVRELAKDLGVSHNLINVRFGTKDDLWRRAVDARVAQIGPPVFEALGSDTLAAEKRLRELLHRFCKWAAQNGDFAALCYVEGRRGTWRNDYIVDAYIRPFKTQLDRLLLEVAAIRPVHPISSTALMALLVQGVSSYFASAPLLERLGVADETSPDRVAGQASLYADFLLSALLPDG